MSEQVLNTIFRVGDEVEIWTWIGHGQWEWQPGEVFEVCAGRDGVPLARVRNRGGRGDDDWGTYWADPERNAEGNSSRLRLRDKEEQSRRETELKARLAAAAATNKEPELQAEPAPNEEETMPIAAVKTEAQASASGFYKVGDKVRVKPEGWAFGEVTAVGAEGVTVAYRLKKVDHSGVFTPAQLKLKDGAEHERRTRLYVDEMVADTPPAAPKAAPRWSDIVKPLDEEEESRPETAAPPARRGMPFDPELQERAERALTSSNGKHELPASRIEIHANGAFAEVLQLAEEMKTEQLANLISAFSGILAGKLSADKAELGARARRREKAVENGQAEPHFPLDEYLPGGEPQPAESCSCRGQLAGPNAVHGRGSCSTSGGKGLPEPAQDDGQWDGESVDEHGAPIDSEGQQIGPEDLMEQGYLSADSNDLGEDLRPLTLGEVTEEMANELPAATQLYFTTPLGFAWRFVISVLDGEKRLWVGYSQPASEGEEGSETKPTSWSKFTEHIGKAVFTLTINGLELRDKALEAFPEWAHANVILPWTAVRDGQRIAGVKSTETSEGDFDIGELGTAVEIAAPEPEPDEVRDGEEEEEEGHSAKVLTVGELTPELVSTLPLGIQLRFINPRELPGEEDVEWTMWLIGPERADWTSERMLYPKELAEYQAAPEGFDDDIWKLSDPYLERSLAQSFELLFDGEMDLVPEWARPYETRWRARLNGERVLVEGITRIGDLTTQELDNFPLPFHLLVNADMGVVWRLSPEENKVMGGVMWTGYMQSHGEMKHNDPRTRERPVLSPSELHRRFAASTFRVANGYGRVELKAELPAWMRPFIPSHVLKQLDSDWEAGADDRRIAAMPDLLRGCSWKDVSEDQLDVLLGGWAPLAKPEYSYQAPKRPKATWTIYAGTTAWHCGDKTINKEKQRRWIENGGTRSLTSSEFIEQFAGEVVRIESLAPLKIQPPGWAKPAIVSHGAQIKAASSKAKPAAKPAPRKTAAKPAVRS